MFPNNFNNQNYTNKQPQFNPQLNPQLNPQQFNKIYGNQPQFNPNFNNQICIQNYNFNNNNQQQYSLQFHQNNFHNKPQFVGQTTNDKWNDYSKNSKNYGESNLYNLNKANSMVPHFKKILNPNNNTTVEDDIDKFSSANVLTENLRSLTKEQKNTYKTFFNNNINTQDKANRYGLYNLKKTSNNSIFGIFGTDKLVEFSKNKITGLSVGNPKPEDIIKLFMTYPEAPKDVSYYSLEYNLDKDQYKVFIYDKNTQKKYLIKVKFNKKDYQCNFISHSNYFNLTVKKNNDTTNSVEYIDFGYIYNNNIEQIMGNVKKQIKEKKLDIDISYKPIEQIRADESTEEEVETGWFFSNCCCCCNDATKYDMNDIEINNKKTNNYPT